MEQSKELSEFDFLDLEVVEQGTFTQFFFSIDDKTLANIAYTSPTSLYRMCMYLTVDQQLLRQEVEKKAKVVC
jgi:hypothetical protein